MAINLLVNANDSALKHLYYHDLKLCFHVMAVFTSHFSVQVAEPSRIVVRSDIKPLPLELWFNKTVSSKLTTMTQNFIWSPEFRQPMSDCVSPTFQALVPWLHSICLMFHHGLSARGTHLFE